MTAPLKALPSDTPEERWRRWQIRGQVQDRRSTIQARIVGTVLFSGVLIALAIQLLALR